MLGNINLKYFLFYKCNTTGQSLHKAIYFIICEMILSSVSYYRLEKERYPLIFR